MTTGGPTGAPAWRRNAAWALVTLAYLFAAPYYERVNNPNENVRVWLTRAIVEHHVLNLDAVEREWGYVNDKAKNQHHVYSGKAPGTSFLGVPVLWTQTKLRQLFGWPAPDKRHVTFWLRLVAVKLPIALFLWVFARYVERVTGSAVARDLLVVALGLGTLMYPYGGLFVGHALAAATAFGAFMAIDWDAAGTDSAGTSPPGLLRAAGVGLLVSATVVFEYQALLVSAALVIYAGLRWRGSWRALLALALGAAPPAIAFAAYHTALFGRPWRLPHGYVENVFFAKNHTAGFLGLSWPHPAAFGSFLFSPAYGLFAFSPVLLLGLVLAVVAFRAARRSRASRDTEEKSVLVLAICAVMFLFLAGMTNWRAGWCVGPRYITTVAPFLLLPIALGWRRLAERWWGTALLAGLIVPSVLLNVLSGALYPHYPEQFDNPVFDLAIPLVGAGYVPYGLGWALGLRGLWAWVPLGAVVLAALALGMGGDDDRPRRWAAQLVGSLAVAAAFLLALSTYGRKPSPPEAQATTTVRALWDPPPPAAARSRRSL
jgi:hypothetical protein